MPPDAFKQNVCWMDEWSKPLDFCQGRVNVDAPKLASRRTPFLDTPFIVEVLVGLLGKKNRNCWSSPPFNHDGAASLPINFGVFDVENTCACRDSFVFGKQAPRFQLSRQGTGGGEDDGNPKLSVEFKLDLE
jgi:hypothetical protein